MKTNNMSVTFDIAPKIHRIKATDKKTGKAIASPVKKFLRNHLMLGCFFMICRISKFLLSALQGLHLSITQILYLIYIAH